MEIHDRVYGLEIVNEPVLIELIESVPLKRLKKINQAGASQYLFPWKTITRFEHCVGVMLLLRKFGANITEQIAGLLHDIPHTAFSHVADFVFANPHHEYHELFHEKIIDESEIAQILTQYRVPKTVVHPEKFGLLERSIPDICADRIDYALRDFMAWKKDRENINTKLSGLTVYKDEFVFKTREAAELFATDYLDLDRCIWADPRETAMYELLAQAIRHALDKKLLYHDDLFTDDETVLYKLQTQGDPFIQKKLAYLTSRFRIELATKEHHHLYIKTKVRYVDPKILMGKEVKRLSTVLPTFKKQLEKHIQTSHKGWYVDVYQH